MEQISDIRRGNLVHLPFRQFQPIRKKMCIRTRRIQLHTRHTAPQNRTIERPRRRLPDARILIGIKCSIRERLHFIPVRFCLNKVSVQRYKLVIFPAFFILQSPKHPAHAKLRRPERFLLFLRLFQTFLRK